METEQKLEPDIKTAKKSYLVPALIAIIIILASSTIYFGWQFMQLKDDNKQVQKQLNILKEQARDTAKAKNQSDNSSDTSSSKGPDAITKNLVDNVGAAISSKNTAALEGYMAPSVNVILAASEGVGPQTPAQAVSSLEYLNSATTPWNFSLPNDTLAIYKNSQYYGKYFGESTIVGKSANDYVVAFGVNNLGKIDTVFMAVNEDLLSQ